MGEVLQFVPRQEVAKAYIRPKIEGALAMSGPPSEPPFEPPKRHLSLVKPVAGEVINDTPSTDIITGSPVSYDLDRRRRLRQSQLSTDSAPAQRSEQVRAIYTPYVPRWERAFVPESSPSARESSVVFSSTTQEKQEVQKDFFYTKEWVQQEVEQVKKQPLNQSETPWWHLKGTGFWVKEQIGQLVRNLKDVGKESFPTVLELELSKVSVDFEHFEREYLLQMASLNWNLALQERDGVKRVICPEYKGEGKDRDGALWSSVTSKQERDGVVYKTLFGTDEEEKSGTGGVEGWINRAKPGSMVFIFSSEGWSGFENITCPEAQCYGIQVLPDGSLKAHTFRYDATINQTEALQKRMGLTIPKAANERERIKNAMENVALLTPEDADRLNIQGFEDFVDLMQESVGGREVAYGEGGGIKTFDEIRSFIRNPEQFMQKHNMTEKLSNRFKEYARWRLVQGGAWDQIEMDLQIAMAFNPLQLNQAYNMKAERTRFHGTDGFGNDTVARDSGVEEAMIHQARFGSMNYEKQKAELEERPGCAGGGNKNAGDGRYTLSSKYIPSMGAPRVGQSTGPENEEQEWFSCSECGWKATGPIGDSACGGCGFTKEKYAEKYGLLC